MNEHILLKWGTIKGWSNLRPSTVEILQKWQDSGVTMSCMAQNDTPEQKELICQAIDQLEGTIKNDWTGETLTKEEARKYIMEYRS